MIGALLRAVPPVLAGMLFALRLGAAIVYVRSGNQPGEEYPYATPETAAALIPTAMEAAAYGDIVLVYPGVYGQFYVGPGPPPYQIKEGVRLVGFGAHRTVILRDTTGGPDSLLSGFRVVGSVLRVPEGLVAVNDCVFDGSIVFAERGAITVRRCRFEGLWNRNYCIEVTEGFGLPVTIQDCSFDLRGTSAQGGIMAIGGAPLTVTGCAFTGCDRAISIGEGRAEISNCVFTYNEVALRSGDLDILVQNCTFYGNGWAITSASNTSSQVFRNCIIWANENGSVLEVKRGYPPDVYLPVVTFSDVEGGYPGPGNINADPMCFFPSADEPDLHLCAFSPCVDAGDPFSDYNNEPEPNGGRVNMGAYGNTWEATTSELVDTDGDNLRDDWEIQNFGNLDGDGSGDGDDDGLLDREEYRHLSDPNNADSDGDSLSDGEEVSLRTDPLVKDTDNDGTPDAKELTQGTNPLDWKDAFTVLDFYIKEGHLYITFPTLPGYRYSLESSNWPNGPFGFTVSPYRGRYGVFTHTDVLRLGPYNRFFRIRAREYPGGEGSR